MVSEFLSYFFFAILMLALVLLIGKLSLSFIQLPRKKFLRIFIELSAGITLLIIVYSLIRSGFNTINLLFLIVVPYYIYTKRKGKAIQYVSFSFNIREYFIELIWVFILFIPVYFFKIIPIAQNWNGSFPIGDLDYFYYSKLSDSLRLYGIENKPVELKLLHPDIFNGCVPYHYCELWLNAFIVWLFKLNSAKTMILLTYPALLLLVNIGFISFIEKRLKVDVLVIILGFLLLFFEGIYLPFYSHFNYLNDQSSWRVMSLTLLQYGKYSFPCLFFLLFLVEYFHGLKKSAFVLLGSMIVSSIGVLPGIIGGVFLFLMIDLFIKNFKLKDKIHLLLYFILLLICYYLFYHFNQTTFTSKYVTSSSNLDHIISDPLNFNGYYKVIKATYNVFSLYLPRLTLFMLPFFVMAVCLKIRYRKEVLNDYYSLVVLISTIFISGSIASVIVGDLLDSLQIFTNLVPLFYLLFSLMCADIIIFFKYKGSSIVWQLGIYIVILYLCFNVRYVYNSSKNIFQEGKEYSTGYIYDVSSEIIKEKDAETVVVGVLLDENDFAQPGIPNYALVLGYYPGTFIHYIDNHYIQIPLNNYLLFDEMDSLAVYDRYYLEISEFYSYVQDQKINHNFTSYEKSQLDFIKKYDVKYLFTKKSVIISDSIRAYVEKEIIDNGSGEKFYILNL
jgi:hypothetical protein